MVLVSLTNDWLSFVYFKPHSYVTIYYALNEFNTNVLYITYLIINCIGKGWKIKSKIEFLTWWLIKSNSFLLASACPHSKLLCKSTSAHCVEGSKVYHGIGITGKLLLLIPQADTTVVPALYCNWVRWVTLMVALSYLFFRRCRSPLFNNRSFSSFVT